MKSHLKIQSSEKIALIYEFNNESPVFARIAAQELEKNDPEKAIEILEKGLEIYPHYPTAYIIYGLAAAHMGNIELAKEFIYKGYEIIEDKNTLDYYIEEVENIYNKFTDRSIKKIPADNGNLYMSPGEVGKLEDDKETNADDIYPEDELDILAKELDKAKVTPVPGDFEISKKQPTDTHGFNFSGDQIISETLAGIYFAQGNLKEALSIYEKLLEAKPERAEFFNKKINDIKDLIAKKR